MFDMPSPKYYKDCILRLASHALTPYSLLHQELAADPGKKTTEQQERRKGRTGKKKRQGREINLNNIKMAGPNPAACLDMLARLVLLRLLYLCCVSFPELLEAYPHSLLHTTLAKLALPEGLINYPCSGLSKVLSWNLGITIIVMAFRFADGFSTRLADSIDLATNPSHPGTPARALSLLLSLGRLLFPIWMEMADIVFAYGFIRILVQFLSPYSPIVQSLSESVWIDYGLYFASSPFIIFVALWILHAMIQTLWQVIFWPVLVTISTQAALRALSPCCTWLMTYFGCSTDILNIQIPSPYIAHLTTDVLGWPADYIMVRYHLVSSAEIRFQECPEWIYSFYCLLSNAYWLLCSLL